MVKIKTEKATGEEAERAEARKRQATVEAVGHTFRYVAMAYAAMSDAARGLIERQIEFGFEKEKNVPLKESARRAQENRGPGRHHCFGVSADKLLGHGNRKDVFSRMYSTWNMLEKTEAFRSNLQRVRNAEAHLRHEGDAKRQNRISTLLGAVTALTLISAATDFFALSGYFDSNTVLGHKEILGVDVKSIRFYLSLTILAALRVDRVACVRSRSW